MLWFDFSDCFHGLLEFINFTLTIKKGENIFGYSSNFSNLGVRRWL